MNKTRSRKKQTTDDEYVSQLIINIEEKLNNIVSTTVVEMMEVCFDERTYKFSYNIEKTTDVVKLRIYIDNDFLNKHAYLAGQFGYIDGLYSQIFMIESDIGFRVGAFLLDIFVYISVLMKVNEITLDNDTDNPLRAAKGIYKMFKSKIDCNDSKIYNKLKLYFDNYDRLNEIYEDDEILAIKHDLENNQHLFMDLLKKYKKMDDIPENLINDLILEKKLHLNNEMIYEVKRNSLSVIKNKIYELIREVYAIEDPNNPWNINVYENLMQQKIIGGKNIKFKTKKYKLKKYKLKKNQTKKHKNKK